MSLHKRENLLATALNIDRMQSGCHRYDIRAQTQKNRRYSDV